MGGSAHSDPELIEYLLCLSLFQSHEGGRQEGKGRNHKVVTEALRSRGQQMEKGRKTKSLLQTGLCFTQEPWQDSAAILHTNMEAGETGQLTGSSV